MNATSTVRRRPGHGGYARGEETRARIIEAAVEVFGSEGFERASTRQIAARAGVNPPALQYYFDSKEGLHRACAQFIVARVQAAQVPVLRIAAEAGASTDRRKAAEAMCDMLVALADMSLTTPNAAGWKRFMARSQADGAGPGIELLRDEMVRPLHQACARLVGIALGRAPDDETTRLRTVLLLSQLSVLHTTRTNALCMLGWSDFNPERLAKVKAAIRAHTLAALTGEAPD